MADTFDAAMDTSGVRMSPVTSLPHRYIFWPSGLCSSPTWMWGRAASAAWGSPGSSPRSSRYRATVRYRAPVST